MKFLKIILLMLVINLSVFGSIERTYVGELQERWRFPSDHLPIGADLVSFRIISWNVLNSAYMKWIYNNEQGLARSLITEEDVPFDESGITVREQHVIASLLEMLTVCHALCLQECSEQLIRELSLRLPENIKIIRSSEHSVKNQNIVLYNTDHLSFIEKQLHMDAFPSEPSRPLMEVVLSDNTIQYRIFNAHLRCDSAQFQRFELAQFVHARRKAGEVTIILGDLNVDQEQMMQALTEGFHPISPYKTTVSPELYSKAIDHIFVDDGGRKLSVSATDANEILQDLQSSVDLLNMECKELAQNGLMGHNG